MDVPEPEKISLKTWLLAVAAVAVCGPWPGWDPHPVAAIALCSAFAVLAQLKLRSWWVWLAPVFALVVFLWPTAEEPSRSKLTSQLDAHCRKVLESGEELAIEPELLRFLGAEGEAVDPAYPFGLLDRSAQNSPGRTLYLADDRGRVVAWGGDGRSFPAGVRPLGQRQWGVVWSVGSAYLWLREPLLVDGRLVGSIVIADHSSLSSDRIWGMRAVRGHALELGFTGEAMLIRASNSPGVEIPVTVKTDRAPADSGMWVIGWLLLAVAALAFEPRVAWVVVAVGSGLLYVAGQPPSDFVVAVAVMLAGAAVGRIAGVLPPRSARTLVVISVVGAGGFSIFGIFSERFDWLPEHLLQPGWGGVWMVALALLIAGWPGLSRESFSLAGRLRVAALLAVLSLGIAAIRVPVDLERLKTPGPGVVLPRDDSLAEDILPVGLLDCRLEDLAPVFESLRDHGK